MYLNHLNTTTQEHNMLENNEHIIPINYCHIVIKHYYANRKFHNDIGNTT